MNQQKELKNYLAEEVARKRGSESDLASANIVSPKKISMQLATANS
jgi:hypothetical protein